MNWPPHAPSSCIIEAVANKARGNRGRTRPRRPPGCQGGRQSAGVLGVGAQRRHQAHARGRLRLCAPARRDIGLPRRPLLGPLLLRAQGRQGQDRGGDLAHHGAGPQVQAGGGAGGDRHRAHHVLPGQVDLPDRHRRAGAGRHRRADGAARGAQEEARRRGPVRRRPRRGSCPTCRASSASSPRRPAPSSATCCTASTSASRCACCCGRCACRARPAPPRWPPPSAASMRCPRAGRCRAPTC